MSSLDTPDHTPHPDAHGIHGVRLTRASGDIILARDSPVNSARLVQPGAPVQDLALKRRSLRDCLADELRRLEPDDLYGSVITHGLAQLGKPSTLPKGVHTQEANS